MQCQLDASTNTWYWRCSATQHLPDTLVRAIAYSARYLVKNNMLALLFADTLDGYAEWLLRWNGSEVWYATLIRRKQYYDVRCRFL